MYAPQKRRHVSPYLTLPLAVAIVFGLVVKLVALQRADIIAELSDQVAHRDTAEASAAVRQLAAMPRPPVAILVAAATSGDHEVAKGARQAIDRLLRRSERQIEAKRGLKPVARQLTELAETLHAQQESFSPADHRWLAGTTHKILNLANQIPPKHTPLVATHCDAILAAVSAVAGVSDPGPSDTNSMHGSKRAALSSLHNGQQTSLKREFAAARRPLETTIASEPVQVGTQVSNDRASDASPDEPIDASWQTDWSHPMFRVPPATPIKALPNDEDPAMPATLSPEPRAMPVETESADRPLAETGSRELLQEWLAAERNRVLPIEQELTRRGFGQLSERFVLQLFSERPEDRLRLVDDVLTEPGADVRPWLMLLADDIDANVRLQAVTIMATSNDAALVEKAWQVAIRDRDARIAGLAGRLRERREQVSRR